MKSRGKFFVIEARRLIPLLFLLMLLIGLTIYDNFFKLEPVVGTPEVEESGLVFTTTDWGELAAPASFKLVADYDQWASVSRDLGLELPDYPFNAADEVAVFAVNSEIQKMTVQPRFREVEIAVQVEPKENFFHVITVDRQSVDHEEAVWKFFDREDRLISRIVPFWHEDKEELEQEPEEDQEEVIK